MLNFERLWIVVNEFLEIFNERDFINGSAMDISLPTPDIIAKDEKIFMPPNHLARRAISFGSLSRAKLSPEELSELIDIFENEKYILVVGKDLKNKRRKWNLIGGRGNLLQQGEEGAEERYRDYVIEQLKIEVQGNCHIILHADANNADIVKSTLALAILRRKLAGVVSSKEFSLQNSQVNGSGNHFDENKIIDAVHALRSRDCMNLILDSREKTDNLFRPFLKVLSTILSKTLVL